MFKFFKKKKETEEQPVVSCNGLVYLLKLIEKYITGHDIKTVAYSKGKNIYVEGKFKIEVKDEKIRIEVDGGNGYIMLYNGGNSGENKDALDNIFNIISERTDELVEKILAVNERDGNVVFLKK